MSNRQRRPVAATIVSIGLLASTFIFTGCTQTPKNQPDQDPTSKFRIGKPYQATYSLPPGSSMFKEEHILWDGNGCIRMDNTGNGGLMPDMISVLDLGKNQSTIWQEGTNAQRVYTRTASGPNDMLMMLVHPMNKAKPEDSLGAKNVNGHSCHGWKSGIDSSTQMWLDDDIGCIVQLSIGSGTMTLTALNPTTPPPAVFQPPPDYTQSNATTGSGNLSGGRRRGFGRGFNYR